MDRSTSFLMSALISFLLLSIQYAESARQNLTMTMNQRHQYPIYDCVDFYKQPAFEHPLLANHTFHYKMRPSWTPKTMRSDTQQLVNGTEFILKGKKCPFGTVPIRRITEEDRIRQKLFIEKYESTPSAEAHPRTHLAIIRTKPDPIKRYNGGSMVISIWNPSVGNSQYSSGQMVIKIGQDNIQVGWTVTPTLNGDHHTHLFIYTSAGETRCLNTHCPAFVIVDKNFIVDEALTESKRGGATYYDIPLMIYKDKGDGHWWLTVGSRLKPVGFWPKELLKSSDTATSVEWGGLAYSPVNEPSPPMGSGAKIEKNLALDASCKLVRVVNMDEQFVDADYTEPITTSNLYEVMMFPKESANLGKYFMWGGPGGLR